MKSSNEDPRIARMFRQDSVWAIIAVLALWALYAFVLYELMHLGHVADLEVLGALAIAGSLVVIFNTASIFAMLKHYAEDRDHIYGLDVHYLDLGKARRASDKPTRSPPVIVT